MHESSTYPYNLYAPTSGLYLIIVNLQFASNSSGKRQVYLRRQGSETMAWTAKSADATDTTYIHLSTIYYLNAGNFVDARAIQDSGDDLNIVNANSAFMMVRLTSD